MKGKVLLSGILLFLLPVDARGDRVNTAVIPTPDIPINFSHAGHLKLGLRCTMCHPGGRTSRNAKDNLLPEEAVCTRCHNVKAPNPAKAFPRATCDTCHPGFEPSEGLAPAAIFMPEPSIKFPHRTHTIIGILCTDCHVGLKQATRPSWTHIPSMERCLTCHDGNAAPNRCNICHVTNGAQRIETNLPYGKLQPSGQYYNADHQDPAWIFRHRVAALNNDAFCNQCHAQSECLDCHAGTKEVNFHPSNYNLLHGRDAYLDNGTCMSCHNAVLDCKQCHTSGKLTQTTQFGQPNEFHPVGWADFKSGTNHHGVFARRGISGCVSCHTEADCIECHSTKTLRVSPHPPGWNSSGWTLQTEVACKKCHE